MNCGRCCMDLLILPEHLIFPERMSIDGQIFVHVHGLDFATLSNLRRGASIEPDGSGRVKIIHACQHLTEDNLCDIYDERPKLCRDFDCSTRADRTCQANVVTPMIFRRGSVN